MGNEFNNYYLRNPNLKKKGSVLEYTEEQILEIAKCYDDIVYFMKNYAYIISLDEGKILFKPYDYQEEIIKTCKNNRFSVLCLRAPTSGSAVRGSINICVRNKKTGDIYELPIKEFYKQRRIERDLKEGNSKD